MKKKKKKKRKKKKKKNIKKEKEGKEEAKENWSWKDEYILLGTDVQSLFPSLSAEKTRKAVHSQFAKSRIQWENIDWKLVTLYVKMHEKYWKGGELDEIRKYLPTRKSNTGRPPSIGTVNVEQKFSWPQIIEYIESDAKKLLMGLAMEIGVVFFFNNFSYTFANEIFLQMFGGPIGARITMAVARLVMQSWKEQYDEILKNSEIVQLLAGLYVDDGRHLHRKLKKGEHFDPTVNKFVVTEEKVKLDLEAGLTREEITRKEILIAMNSVNSDLTFTM